MSKPTENTNKPSASAENNRYFNEYANGIGYLNSIREFGAEGKLKRYAAQVSVIQGPAENVHYEYHDLIISSETVLGVVLEHREAIEAEEANVLIRFNIHFTLVKSSATLQNLRQMKARWQSRPRVVISNLDLSILITL